jgi:hypothetical protein
MQLNDLLSGEGIDPEQEHVMVLRHVPVQPGLRKVLPWLVVENHDLFNAYQQTQGPKVEKAMQRAKYVASFIGHEPRKALFVGLYQMKGHRLLSHQGYWEVAANIELREKYGIRGLTNRRASTLWFDLVRMKFREDWIGKLVVTWPGKELAWWRWAHKNAFLVFSIAEDSVFERRMPPWNQLTLTWNELGLLPRRWREELSRWRGIYFILDEKDGKGYVGAAYGEENLLGRWCNYAKTGHGGNKRLRRRDPRGFRFTVLQILPHDMNADDVHPIEKTWKDRLHTREFGLNDN